MYFIPTFTDKLWRDLPLDKFSAKINNNPPLEPLYNSLLQKQSFVILSELNSDFAIIQPIDDYLWIHISYSNNGDYFANNVETFKTFVKETFPQCNQIKWRSTRKGWLRHIPKCQYEIDSIIYKMEI